MSGEISYDLVMEEDMSFVEGTFRVGPSPWSVFIVSKRAVELPVWEAHTWESGVTGLVFHVPLATSLDTASVEALLSRAIGCDQWQRANGPDSMVLR